MCTIEQSMCGIPDPHRRPHNVFTNPVNIEDAFITPIYPKSPAAFELIVNSLASSFIFSSLTKEERSTLIDAMEMESVPSGTTIIEQGDKGDYFYVVNNGQVSFFVDGRPSGVCTCGAFFGELALLYNCPRAATCMASSACQLWKVDQRTFSYTLVKNRIHNSIESVDGSFTSLDGLPNSKVHQVIQLKDIDKHCILGVGTFSKVWLVSNPEDGKTYALKMMNKHALIAHHQVDGVLRETNILSSIDHPFIVNLVSNFQDHKNVYMLLSLHQGGELFSVIHTNSRDGVSNAVAIFYAACILESLSHLHLHHICYRDLKPENILIDSHGYCILTDFGFAKVVVDKTYTLCGTPQYFAPEIIFSNGHDEGVDCWAFGVLIYEMIVGRSPFYTPGINELSLFQNIINVDYSFPPNEVVDNVTQEVIQHLLVKSQASRYKCVSGEDKNIRDHEWFDGIEFDKLVKKQYCAPWVPHIQNPLDAMYFDSYIDVEEEHVSENPPLSSYQQSLFKEFAC